MGAGGLLGLLAISVVSGLVSAWYVSPSIDANVRDIDYS